MPSSRCWNGPRSRSPGRLTSQPRLASWWRWHRGGVGIVVALASWWRWHRGGVADARLPDPAGLVEREQFAARDNRREVDSAVGPVKQARSTRRTGAEWAIPSADPPSCGQEQHGVEKEVRTR